MLQARAVAFDQDRYMLETPAVLHAYLTSCKKSEHYDSWHDK